MAENTTKRVAARCLKARYVFPVTGAPIPDGVVTIEGQRIAAVGRRSPDDHVEDLGNVAILPGLVNPHVHLEFSDLATPLGKPGIEFIDWIGRVVEQFRRGSRPSPEVAQHGLRECVLGGTTMLGEIAQPDWRAEAFGNAALDATIFLELIAPTVQRAAPLLNLARQHLKAADPSGRWHAGLSPHAPYSVVPQMLAESVAMSAAGRVPVAFHLAESREELELLRSGSGPFRDHLQRLGPCDPALFAPGRRPLDYLRILAAAHRTLVIHGNYLDDDEIAFLAGHARQMSAVYCPRTHAYFGHDPYPLEKMLSAGVTVAVGTDSRASSPDLSVLAELRFVARHYPALAPDVVLQLGTVGAAQALGRDGEAGSLDPGKFADLAVVALPNHDAADPHQLLFDCDWPVTATWFRGSTVSRP